MWNEISCTKLQLPPEPLTRGLLPPDPRILCPLSSTEFVEPPPNKIPGYATAWSHFQTPEHTFLTAYIADIRISANTSASPSALSKLTAPYTSLSNTYNNRSYEFYNTMGHYSHYYYIPEISTLLINLLIKSDNIC